MSLPPSSLTTPFTRADLCGLYDKKLKTWDKLPPAERQAREARMASNFKAYTDWRKVHPEDRYEPASRSRTSSGPLLSEEHKVAASLDVMLEKTGKKRVSAAEKKRAKRAAEKAEKQAAKAKQESKAPTPMASPFELTPAAEMQRAKRAAEKAEKQAAKAKQESKAPTPMASPFELTPAAEMQRSASNTTNATGHTAYFSARDDEENSTSPFSISEASPSPRAYFSAQDEESGSPKLDASPSSPMEDAKVQRLPVERLRKLAAGNDSNPKSSAPKDGAPFPFELPNFKPVRRRPSDMGTSVDTDGLWKEFGLTQSRAASLSSAMPGVSTSTGAGINNSKSAASSRQVDPLSASTLQALVLLSQTETDRHLPFIAPLGSAKIHGYLMTHKDDPRFLVVDCIPNEINGTPVTPRLLWNTLVDKLPKNPANEPLPRVNDSHSLALFVMPDLAEQVIAELHESIRAGQSVVQGVINADQSC